MELDKDTKEVEPKGRKVILHFVRHGAAGYSGRDDAEGYLTEKGEEQAEAVAEQIYEQLPEGAIIESLSSNRGRAVGTAKVIEKKMRELEVDKGKGLIFHGDQVKTLNRLGISDEITQEYLDLINEKEWPIRYWLEHPGKTPDEIKKNFGSFTRHMSRFTSKLGPGPEIHLIIPVHSGPTEVFVGQLLGDSTVPSLANCEQFTLELSNTKAPAVISYKDIKEKINLKEI